MESFTRPQCNKMGVFFRESALRPIYGRWVRGGLLELTEFNPIVAAESAQRRQYYANEERRRQFRAAASGDYREFLRLCEIKVRISPVEPANVSRAHELIQRTNQLTFSGTRYSRRQIEEIVANPALCASFLAAPASSARSPSAREVAVLPPMTRPPLSSVERERVLGSLRARGRAIARRPGSRSESKQGQ